MSRHNRVATAYFSNSQWTDPTTTAAALIDMGAVVISRVDLPRYGGTAARVDRGEILAAAGAKASSPPVPVPSSTLYRTSHTDVLP